VGNCHKGTKSGQKSNDLNGNGTKDSGEPGLALWEVRAYVDGNGNGPPDSRETTVASTTTDALGNYTLSLNPGTYVVCEVLQSGWTQSFPTGNTRCAAVSGLGQAGYALTVSSNSSESNNDFGNFQQGTKSGQKFNDLNGNGTKDSGEPGLSGWTIRAYSDTDGDGTLSAVEAAAPAASTTTD